MANNICNSNTKYKIKKLNSAFLLIHMFFSVFQLAIRKMIDDRILESYPSIDKLDLYRRNCILGVLDIVLLYQNIRAIVTNCRSSHITSIILAFRNILASYALLNHFEGHKAANMRFLMFSSIFYTLQSIFSILHLIFRTSDLYLYTFRKFGLNRMLYIADSNRRTVKMFIEFDNMHITSELLFLVVFRTRKHFTIVLIGILISYTTNFLFTFSSIKNYKKLKIISVAVAFIKQLVFTILTIIYFIKFFFYYDSKNWSQAFLNFDLVIFKNLLVYFMFRDCKTFELNSDLKVRKIIK